MYQQITHTLNKYFFFFFCFLFIYNNVFAVKPVHNPTVQMESLSIEDLANTSIKDFEKQSGKKFKLKEKLVFKIPERKMKKESSSIYSDTSSIRELVMTYRKTKKIKQISEGQYLKVRTIDKKTIKGKLAIIDDQHISVDGQQIALEAIKNIVTETSKKKKLKKRYNLFDKVGYQKQYNGDNQPVHKYTITDAKVTVFFCQHFP